MSQIYVRQFVIIRLRNTYLDEGHAIVGFTCNGIEKIYNSNDHKIHTFNWSSANLEEINLLYGESPENLEEFGYLYLERDRMSDYDLKYISAAFYIRKDWLSNPIVTLSTKELCDSLI